MFTKATRKNVKIKIAFTGPSGSGKTMSSLLMAKGLGQKVVLLDTENSSASNYSHLDFDTATIKAPYDPKKIIEMIDCAVKEGYDTIIIDSLSHFWSSEGGILDQKSLKDARGGSSYNNWAEFTKIQNKMVEKIMNCDAHIIATMRSKTEYLLQENEKGKMQPIKVGLAPVQRDAIEYEFSVVLDVAMNHSAIASKDRTGLFADKIFVVTKDHGKIIKEWLNDGEYVEPQKLESLADLAMKIKDEKKREYVLGRISQVSDEIARSGINEILSKQQ
jgi:hypothetical protein